MYFFAPLTFLNVNLIFVALSFLVTLPVIFVLLSAFFAAVVAFGVVATGVVVVSGFVVSVPDAFTSDVIAAFKC